MLSVELIDTVEQWKEVKGEWNEAVACSDMNMPFLAFEWLSTWWEVYGPDHGLAILLARDGDEIVGIAPFMRTRMRLRGLPVRVVSFMDNSHASRMGLILKRGAREVVDRMLHALRSLPGGYDVMMLHNVPEGSDTDTAVRSVAQERRISFLEIPGDAAPYTTVEGGWEDFFKGRSKNFRHNIKRKTNMFQRVGDYTVTKHVDGDIAGVMDELVSVSRRTWKYKAGTAIANDGRKVLFYRRLAETAAARGWLNLWMLRLHGRAIAFAFNVTDGRKIYALKIGYDEEYGGMSPSEFLNMHAVLDCFEAGLSEYDWTGKDESYKMYWATGRRAHRKYMLFSESVYGGMLYMLKAGSQSLARRLLRRAGADADGSSWREVPVAE